MKKPRKDDLPAFEEIRVIDVVEQVENEAGKLERKPTGERINTGVTPAHHLRTQLRFNGPPATFVKAMRRIGVTADAMEIAQAVFAAHSEAELDAAAYGDAHRKPARRQIKVEIDALEATRAALFALREAQSGVYSPDRLAGLVARRNGPAGQVRQLDVSAVIDAVDADLAEMRALADALNGQGEARRTRLRFFAERLAPLYLQVTGKAPKATASAYDEAGEPAGFAAFLIAAACLTTGVAPGRTLIESVTKAISGK